MVYTYYMVCMTYVQIKQLVPARPPKSLNGDRFPLIDTYRLPLLVLRDCFAAKKHKSSFCIKRLNWKTECSLKCTNRCSNVKNLSHSASSGSRFSTFWL